MIRRCFILFMILLVSGGGVLSAPPSETDYQKLLKKNRELREKLVKAENELANYRLWFANMGVEARNKDHVDREKRLLMILNEMAKRGNNLSLSALMIGDECRKLLREMPVGPARKAQIELRLDELEKAAGSFAGMAVPSDSGVANCRILSVSYDLKVAVISAGASAGVFPGMVFRAKNNPSLRVIVIGTRFEGAVVELISGEWHDLVPGTEFSALYRRDATD